MTATLFDQPSTYREAVAALGRHGLHTALRTGRITRLWHGVFVPRERALDPVTRARAALLVVGDEAALSGPTAASMYGCTAASCTDVHVTVPYTTWRRSQPGLVVHHDRFSPDDVLELDGLPVLALDLVIAELLCGRPRRSAVACADQAMGAFPENLRPEFRQQVRDRLEVRDDRRGVPGAFGLLDVVTGKAESPPESWLRLLVIDSGLPPPTPQYEIYDLSGQLVYRLDLAWPELRIALEYDGFETHEQRAEQDEERDRRMSARGWITVRATAADIRKPGHLLNRLRDAFSRRAGAR